MQNHRLAGIISSENQRDQREIGRKYHLRSLAKYYQELIHPENAIQLFNYISPLFLYCHFKLTKQCIQNHASKEMKKIVTKGEFEKINLKR